MEDVPGSKPATSDLVGFTSEMSLAARQPSRPGSWSRTSTRTHGALHYLYGIDAAAASTGCKIDRFGVDSTLVLLFLLFENWPHADLSNQERYLVIGTVHRVLCFWGSSWDGQGTSRCSEWLANTM